MKKLFGVLVVLFSFVSFNSIAQERVNEAPYVFSSQSPKVTKIVGWYWNDSTGQWVGNDNFIYKEQTPYLNDKRFSRGANSVQVKTFEYGDKTHYILIIAFNGGHYLYPNIEQEWRKYVEYTVYSLTQEEYDYILSPSDRKEFELPYIDYKEYYESYDDNKLIREVVKDRIYTSKGRFSIKRYNDVIRFYYASTYYGKESRVMDKEYFEVSIGEWENLKLNIDE